MTTFGFTGTRHELTSAQKIQLRHILHAPWRESPRERPIFHHGACKGADSFAALEAYSLNYDVIAHPGKSAHGGDNEWLCPLAIEHSTEIRQTKSHFARNRDIVDECDVLIACPQYVESITPETKGGTAYTVTYARKVGRPVIIIRPDGTVKREGSDLGYQQSPASVPQIEAQTKQVRREMQSIGAEIVASLKGFIHKLKSGEPIEVTRLVQEQTPDGPLTTREKKVI